MKKFFVLFFVCFMLLLGSVSAFAWTTPTGTDYVVYFNTTDSNYYYIKSVSNVAGIAVIKYVPTDLTLTSNSGLARYKWDNTSNSWLFDINGFSATYVAGKNLLSSDKDIINYSTGDVFFSPTLTPTPTPVPLPVPVQSLLFGNLIQVFGQSLPILLPVGLIILSVLLGVSLIPRLLRLFL